MTNEQAKKFANCLKNNYTIDFNDMADFCDTVIKALEQETVSKEVYDNEHFARKKAEQKLYEIQQNTSDDCVSRQAVLDLMQLKMGGKELYKAVYDLPPVTPTFPEGATNGDMITTMFPNVKISINELLGASGTVFIYFKSEIIIVSLDWWNAPYKRGNEDE